MFDMRLRLPELMSRAGITTAYGLSKATKGEMTISNAQRLIAAAGHPERIALRTLDVLCKALNARPQELFELDDPPKRR